MQLLDTSELAIEQKGLAPQSPPGNCLSGPRVGSVGCPLRLLAAQRPAFTTLNKGLA